ncbi:MAG: LysM peptidoglycan-binding domain-containing protein [Nitrospirae bacterium]|nr:LysM peptidoglycan-binding domain-containing protein [Nitrospirota bacterium]
MIIKRIGYMCVLTFLFFVFAYSYLFGQEMEYKEYKIQKGDTLWDISSKEFAEKDPFLWPKIWKENLDIKNPDLIYPGQTIKIPLKLLLKEMPEEAVPEEKVARPEPVKTEPPKKEEPPKPVERKIEPITKGYVADKDLLISSGYITDYISDQVKNVGRIVSSPSGRTLLGESDFVYIKTNNPVNIGEKFYILRSAALVKHPKTKNKLGHLIEVPGIVEVVGTENGSIKAKVIQSYNDVRIGDLLDTYYEVEPVMEEDSPRTPEVSGYIVATRHMKIISSSYDILFIDKGSSNGLEVGDMLKTISIDPENKSRTTGAIQIISLKNTTATAIIKRSEGAVGTGDAVVSLK